MANNMNKNKGLWWKVPTGIILSLLGLFGLVWGGLNGLKYAIYDDFYAIMEKNGNIPGINDGFTPQGICVSEENKVTIMTGYQKDSKQASRIYLSYADGSSRYINILDEKGNAFTGHNGGIAVVNDSLYIATTDGTLVDISLQDVLNKDNKEVKLNQIIALDNNAADFIFSYDDKIIVGEFNNNKSFQSNNEYETKNDGKYYAIAEEYLASDLTKPLRSFSIRNQVQGLAMNDEGDIVLSTSFSVADSVFYFYKADSFTKSDLLHKDAPLFYLDNPTATLKAPAMTEDMDYSNGKWITYTESACDKYMFGKLFFSDYYYSFAWDF